MNAKTPRRTRLRRFAPLAAAASALLTIVAYMVIGPNPDSDAPTSTITAYYAAHHAHVRSPACYSPTRPFSSRSSAPPSGQDPPDRPPPVIAGTS